MEINQSIKRRLKNLIGWLNTFQMEEPVNTIEELKNGHAMIEVLMQIEPEWFTENWKEYIKIDKPIERKLYNMQQIIDSVIEYYKEYLVETLTMHYVTPNAQKIVEQCDTQEMYRLLQLILSCAVKCQRKNDFIEVILQTNPNVMLEAITDLQIRNFVCYRNHGIFLFENLPKLKNENKTKRNNKQKEIICDLCTIIVHLYTGKNTMQNWSNKYRQLQKKTLKINQEKLSLITRTELLLKQLEDVYGKHIQEYRENERQSVKYTHQNVSSRTEIFGESKPNRAKYRQELHHIQGKINGTHESITKVMRDMFQEVESNEAKKREKLKNSFIKETESMEFDQMGNSGQNIEKQESQLSADKVNLKTKTENINFEDVHYIEKLEQNIKDSDARLIELTKDTFCGYNKRKFDVSDEIYPIRDTDALPAYANKIDKPKQSLSSTSTQDDFELIEFTDVDNEDQERLSSSIDSLEFVVDDIIEYYDSNEIIESEMPADKENEESTK